MVLKKNNLVLHSPWVLCQVFCIKPVFVTHAHTQGRDVICLIHCMKPAIVTQERDAGPWWWGWLRRRHRGGDLSVCNGRHLRSLHREAAASVYHHTSQGRHTTDRTGPFSRSLNNIVHLSMPLKVFLYCRSFRDAILVTKKFKENRPQINDVSRSRIEVFHKGSWENLSTSGKLYIHN